MKNCSQKGLFLEIHPIVVNHQNLLIYENDYEDLDHLENSFLEEPKGTIHNLSHT